MNAALESAAFLVGSAQPEERQHRNHHDHKPNDVYNVIHSNPLCLRGAGISPALSKTKRGGRKKVLAALNTGSC